MIMMLIICFINQIIIVIVKKKKWIFKMKSKCDMLPSPIGKWVNEVNKNDLANNNNYYMNIKEL